MFGLFYQQPRAFRIIFMLEVWERFGYYTVQGILTLYFVKFIGLSEQLAYYTFGAFFALVYSMVIVGGYLGDRVLGAKRTLILGLFVLAIGYCSLAWVDKTTVYYALAIICVGNGLFKANPASLLAKCYDKNDPRLYSAFTLFYMAINLGSICSLLAGPLISSYLGYSYAFFLAAIGIVLGLANYGFQHQHLKAIKIPDEKTIIPLWVWLLIILGIIGAIGVVTILLQHVRLAKMLVLAVAIMATLTYFNLLLKQQRSTRWKMLLAFILMLEAVIFFSLYQQMPTSLNLFAVNNVDPHLLGIAIDPQCFQALNPIWIVIMSPVLAWFYNELRQRNINFAIPYKFASGMLFCAVSFLILFFTRFAHDDSGQVSAWWLVASYLFQSIGELMVSALGVAMVADLVPVRIAGFVMGMWFLTSATAGFLGASIASYAALSRDLKPGLDSLMMYTGVFAYIGLGSLAIGLLLWLLSPLLTRLMDD
ncbi:MAG: oligopeptide:H+ symporter [Legionella sp.]